MNNLFLTFSDGAKFALVARNLILGNGFTTDFSFWGNPLFGTSGIPYLLPVIMSFFFRLFGVSDFSVILFSFSFYLLLIIAVFLLSQKLFGSVVGFLSTLAVAFNPNIIDYATSGASETLFMFEIVLALYLTTYKKWSTDIFALLSLAAMYFSRPQAFIFMAGIFLYWLLVRFGFKKGLIYFFSASFVAVLVDKYVIYPLSFKIPLTPVFMRGIQSILTYSSDMAVSDGLRGAASSTLTASDVFKKVFYNLYNFYKLLPDIINPYLFILFIIGLFRKNSAFNISVLFMTAITFLVTALTIPFYRYLHPVVPLIYIVAINTLYEIVKNKKIALVLVLIFCVGQTLGMLFLDSRFKNKMVNSDKPPIYSLMSVKLKEVTNNENIILTNLDTWGSWYGERKTVWFPLTPNHLLGTDFKIDYIYLTSYRMDDENYYMGQEWREIFENPKKQNILPDYKFVAEYEFNPEDNYQREKGRAVLLIKK